MVHKRKSNHISVMVAIFSYDESLENKNLGLWEEVFPRNSEIVFRFLKQRKLHSFSAKQHKQIATFNELKWRS